MIEWGMYISKKNRESLSIILPPKSTPDISQGYAADYFVNPIRLNNFASEFNLL